MFNVKEKKIPAYIYISIVISDRKNLSGRQLNPQVNYVRVRLSIIYKMV